MREQPGWRARCRLAPLAPSWHCPGMPGTRCAGNAKSKRKPELTARMAMTKPTMVMALLAPSEVLEQESVTGSLFRALHR